MKIRKVDENLKEFIRTVVKNGNPLNLTIKDFGYYLEIMCPVSTFHVYKMDFLKMMMENSDIKN